MKKIKFSKRAVGFLTAGALVFATSLRARPAVVEVHSSGIDNTFVLRGNTITRHTKNNSKGEIIFTAAPDEEIEAFNVSHSKLALLLYRPTRGPDALLAEYLFQGSSIRDHKRRGVPVITQWGFWPPNFKIAYDNYGNPWIISSRDKFIFAWYFPNSEVQHPYIKKFPVDSGEEKLTIQALAADSQGGVAMAGLAEASVDPSSQQAVKPFSAELYFQSESNQIKLSTYLSEEPPAFFLPPGRKVTVYPANTGEFVYLAQSEFGKRKTMIARYDVETQTRDERYSPIVISTGPSEKDWDFPVITSAARDIILVGANKPNGHELLVNVVPMAGGSISTAKYPYVFREKISARSLLDNCLSLLVEMLSVPRGDFNPYEKNRF
jgi:hypothetical protein